jgi:hypothetical protein
MPDRRLLQPLGIIAFLNVPSTMRAQGKRQRSSHQGRPLSLHRTSELCEGLHRRQCQQLLHLTVSEHDVRCALQGLIVAPLIPVAELRGANQ